MKFWSVTVEVPAGDKSTSSSIADWVRPILDREGVEIRITNIRLVSETEQSETEWRQSRKDAE